MPSEMESKVVIDVSHVGDAIMQRKSAAILRVP